MVGATVVAVGTETGEARAEGAVVETYVEMAGKVGVGRGRAGGVWVVGIRLVAGVNEGGRPRGWI